MSLHLETRDLTKNFGAFKAVDGVSLSFAPGKIHAVLGENGAGKSTLMKLLFGLHSPTRGQVLINKKPVRWASSMDAIRLGLGMVQQHFSLVPTLSAIDNIILGAEIEKNGRLNRTAAIQKLESLVINEALRVPWHTPVSELSVGQKQRVEILKVLFREAQFIILDEPTAVLTPQEIEEFFSVLKLFRDQGRTVVVITHKIGEVFKICDTYSILRQGRLTASGLVQEATPETLVEAMIGRKVLPASVERVPHQEQTLVCVEEVQDLSLLRGSVRNLSLNVFAGEIVGIAGVEGSGQTNLVEMLTGLRAFKGKISVLQKDVKATETKSLRECGLGWIPEDRLLQGLWIEESCSNNMVIGIEDRFSKFGVLDFAKIEHETKPWADEFVVKASSLKNNAGSLSGGNQQKLIFAREVSGRRPKFLICHQPTRGIDLGAIEIIHNRLLALRNQGMGILLISSELDELMTLADRILVFFEGEISAEFTRAQFDRFAIGRAMTQKSFEVYP